MKTVTRLLTAACILFLIAGCNRSTRVEFKPALVSIDPGKGWKRTEFTPTPPACSPQLTSKSGMINVLLLDTDTADLKQAADKLQASSVVTGRAVPDSFKQEDFVSGSGLNGIQLSYSGRSFRSVTPDMRSHSFIIKNRGGQFVSVNYTASPETESNAVLEAIRKSLKLD
jgi:hypothetical protein